jgi:hypothetical protein
MIVSRHCEEPTGRPNGRPMTGSATKQSNFTAASWIASSQVLLAMTVEKKNPAEISAGFQNQGALNAPLRSA